jgi:tetratricopeptide (TPR) repeat protein
MKCNKCGATLTDSSFCNNCGASVKIYKKLISTSNALYNRGLEKAQVRDLSGARDDLKNSLKVYKKNIPARNLLGLVYFEMGDVVSALSEWIISKNYQPQDNIADKYIEAVQNNSGKLDAYNVALKKYNQALLYARTGSLDLAVIQLKKVLSIHDKFVSAHLLLALVAIETNQIELARKELKKVLHIDRGNVVALNYFRETDALRGKGTDKKSSKISRDAIAYTSGNETIIQPKAVQEHHGRNAVLDILLGLIIGIAVCWFVLAPAKIQSANNEANQQVIEYSDQLEAKTATIEKLTKERDNAKLESLAAKAEADTVAGKANSYESLFKAQKLAEERKFEEAVEALKNVDEKVLEDGAKTMYQEVQALANATVIEDLYNKGVANYNAGKYEEAKADLVKVVEINPAHDYAQYYLARTYAGLEDVANAKVHYQKVLELLPLTTQRAKTAQNYINTHP